MISLFVTFLFGCSSTPIPDPEPEDTVFNGSNIEANSSNEADTYGTPANGFIGGEYIDNNAEKLSEIIFFDFDSSAISTEDHDLILKHAKKINENPLNNVRLEGHTDELGSREYNIGLGERRAQAVRQMLMIHGVNSSQIITVSFGEERPDMIGRSEDDYAKNRRTEIKYIN
tara:strand:+ start:444 stop:959 length:516 start_codon:yes stop_codon:yes gene_type:complete